MTLLKKLINSIFCSDLQAPAANKVRLIEVLKVWSEELRSGKSIEFLSNQKLWGQG